MKHFLLASLLAFSCFDLAIARIGGWWGAQPQTVKPSIDCHGEGAMFFTCTAKNFGDNAPKWTLYDKYQWSTEGESATFPAPSSWTLLKVQIGDEIISTLVRRHGDHVIFRAQS